MNREGVAIAVEMLCELESVEMCDTKTCTNLAEFSNIENWARQGRPFRNIVAECLVRARAAGPDVESGFCAVLSDLTAQLSQGTCPDAGFYEGLYNLGES